MAIYFAPIGCGLGDLIVSLPIISWLVTHNREPVILVERGPRQQNIWPRVGGIQGAVEERLLRLTSSDTLVNMRDHHLSRDHNWGSDRFLTDYSGWNIDDIQASICADFGITPDFENLTPLAHDHFPQTEQMVLLIPGTTGDYKTWPASMWLPLYQRIRRDGIKCAVMGEPEHSTVVAELRSAGVPHISTPTIGEAIDAISSAMSVIAVDTGLQHIAVQQGIKTVAVVNWLNTYVRRTPHCHQIVSPICEKICMIPHPDNPNNPVLFGPDNWRLCEYMHCQAPPEKHCMSQIAWQDVFEAFSSLNGIHAAT